jgi:hypothetical protein
MEVERQKRRDERVPCAMDCTRIPICAAKKMPISGHFSIEKNGVVAKGGIEPRTHGFSVQCKHTANFPQKNA